MFWDIPPADWLILQLSSAQADPRNEWKVNMDTDGEKRSVCMLLVYRGGAYPIGGFKDGGRGDSPAYKGLANTS